MFSGCYTGSDLANDIIWLQEIQDLHVVSEVAFTGDTTIDFLESDSAELALNAKLLIIELTYLEDSFTTKQAQVASL